MLFKEKFFKYAAGITLILLIIYLFGKVDFLLVPFKKLIFVLFFPILIAGFFYYLLRPLVRIAVKFHIPRGVAILGSFLIILVLFSAIGSYAGSLIWKQLNQLMHDFPQIAQTVTNKFMKLINNKYLGSVITDKTQQELTTYLKSLVPFIQDRIFGAISTLTNIFTILLIVPFILYYMLKDDHRLNTNIMKYVPQKYTSYVLEILEDTDKTLSSYITGKAIIALILGVLMYIGYMAIGLKYTFILALFVVFTSFIPMFGSFIGVIPAMLVAVASSPMMVLKVFIIMIVAQQLEGNLISPFLIGKRLDIHPLTLILLFMVAAALYGFIGMLIAVPTYAVLKIVFKGAYRIYQLRKQKSEAVE